MGNSKTGIFLWSIAILIVTARLSEAQQTIPGIWKKVTLPASSFVSDFGFRDSLLGLAWDFFGGIEYTTDGGRSWAKDSAKIYPGIQKLYLNSVECTGANRGFFFGTAGPTQFTEALTPWGITETTPPAGGDNGFGLYYPIAERMIDTASGYRLVEEQDLHGILLDSLVLLVTHDAWSNSTSYGSAYTWKAPYNSTAGPQQVFCGLVLDSSEVWTANLNMVLHTTDAGWHWDSMQVVDTSRYSPEWKDFFVNGRNVYAEAQYGSVDFVYSSDGGATWRADSTFGLRLWRMAVPAPGIIWGMLGNGDIANILIYPSDAKIYPNDLSNKIGYSSDNGVTWNIDSVTFAKDSLVEMHFTDARHGWIAGYSNGNSHIWYYDADGTADVKPAPSTSIPLRVYPNPAQDEIHVLSNAIHLSLIDMLGRSYDVPKSGDRLDVSHLTPGVYYISDGLSHAKFVKQ